MSEQVKGWLEDWESDCHPWQLPVVHPSLERYADRLFGTDKKGKRVFVPLCGKSYDMKWLVDQGHEVIGAEASDIAVKQFFDEFKIPYTVEGMVSVEDGKLFISSDKKYHIYCCDVFAMNPSKEIALKEPFDAVWDRGSMEALGEDFRPKYGKLMDAVVNAQTTYLLETADSEPSEFGPQSLTKEEVKNVFERECTVDVLETLDFKDLSLDENEKPPGLRGFVMYWLTFK